MLNDHRDVAAVKADFHSARTATGAAPELVMTDSYGTFPPAFRGKLSDEVAELHERLREQPA